MLAALVTVITVALVTAAGPIEDLTAPQRRRTAGVPRALVGAGTIPCLLVAVIVLPIGELETAGGSYAPASGRGLDRLITARSVDAATHVEDWDEPSGPVTARELDELFDDWRNRWDISGAAAAISPTMAWCGPARPAWTVGPASRCCARNRSRRTASPRASPAR